jgi:predicted nucleic acid-binding protein
VIYLDTSALVKLAHAEPFSDELHAWLTARPGRFAVASALARAETHRALRRSDPSALSQVPSVLSRLFVLPVNDRILDLAGNFTDPLLRTLDAVHLATARLLGAPGLSFVTYDKRLLAAATGEGFESVAPGASRLGSYDLGR